MPDGAIFDPGLHSVLGTTLYLEAHRVNTLEDAPRDDESQYSYLDRSAAYLSRTILTLLIFLLVASSIVGERERGTLELLLAQGIPRSSVIFGKTLVFSGLVLGLVFVSMLIAGLLGPMSKDALVRLGLLSAGYAFFLLIAVFIGMAVSIRTKSSQTTITILLFIWAFSALLGPKLTTSLALALNPLPLQFKVYEELQKDLDSSGYLKRTEELKGHLLAEHGVETVEELPFEFRGQALQSDEERSSFIYEEYESGLRARLQAQDKWLHIARFFLPWLAVEQWSSAVVGTDLKHVERFVDVSEKYRREMVKLMNQHLMVKGQESQSGEALWSTVPEFSYVQPGVNYSFSYAFPAIFILFLWTVGSFLFVVGSIKYLGRFEESV